MRKRFEAQLTLGCTPIEQIVLPVKSRDEFPSYLRAVQYVYSNQELSEQIFSLLEQHICNKKPTGRPGMDLWMLFVLAGARLCLNADYDRLTYLANYDSLLRPMLGVHDGMVRGRDFDIQTIKDNVSLLDDDTLRQINLLIVQASHGLLKKKEQMAPLRIKVDSFTTESTVHFPTDYNLLWDSGRKCTDVLHHLIKANPAYGKGWRKIDHWRRSLKNSMLRLVRAIADKSKNREKRLQESVGEYLGIARGLSAKVHQMSPLAFDDLLLFIDLEYYLQMLDKHIDLVERRLVKGETIPQEEKVFSIFETYTEWLCKGKKHKPVELGKRTSVATDQHHFIVDYWVADHQQDNHLLLPSLDRIREHFTVGSCSADKGFFSKENVDIMESFDIKSVIPKKGKRSAVETQRETDPGFVKLKRKHSAIESNINELEHRGLNRCPDKGIRNFRRYVALAVLAYNLRRMGKLLLEADRAAAGTAKQAA